MRANPRAQEERQGAPKRGCRARRRRADARTRVRRGVNDLLARECSVLRTVPVELRERHHRLDRWVSLLADQAVKTPTKPAVWNAIAISEMNTLDSFRLFGVCDTVAGTTPLAQLLFCRPSCDRNGEGAQKPQGIRTSAGSPAESHKQQATHKKPVMLPAFCPASA
jgi:hypothetical protein